MVILKSICLRLKKLFLPLHIVSVSIQDIHENWCT